MAPSTAPVTKICPSCSGSAFRRINRKGWLQRVLLARLGFFPWECVHCRQRRFYHDSGQRPGHRHGHTAPFA